MSAVNVYIAAGSPNVVSVWRWRTIAIPQNYSSVPATVCGDTYALIPGNVIVDNNTSPHPCSPGYNLIIELDDPANFSGQYIFDLEQGEGDCTWTNRAIIEFVHTDIQAVPDVCYYTMCVESVPSGTYSSIVAGTPGQWSNTTPVNSQCRQWKYARIITANNTDCLEGIPPEDQIVTQIVDEDCSAQPLLTGMRTHSGSGCEITIVNGAYIGDLYLFEHPTGNAILIDLSSEVYAGDLGAWATAIRDSIIGQLNASPYNYTLGTNFSDLIVEAPTTNFQDFRIWMGCKHNPSVNWVGILADYGNSWGSSSYDFHYDGTSNYVTANHADFKSPDALIGGVGTPPITIVESYPLPICEDLMEIEMTIGKVQVTMSGPSCTEDGSTISNPDWQFDFNNLKAPNSPTANNDVEVDIDFACINDAACDDQTVDLYAVTANPYGQQTNLSYQWTPSGGTTSMITVQVMSGQHDVSISIPMPSGATPATLVCTQSIIV